MIAAKDRILYNIINYFQIKWEAVSMKKNVIITIGRQFGSGGHEVGKRLSDRLGIPLYDRNLIQMASRVMDVLRTKYVTNRNSSYAGAFR